MTSSLFPIAAQYAADFESAWTTYRYKRGKDAAWRAWRKCGVVRPELPLLILCIEEYRADLAKTKLSQAHFASWLNGKRWLDFMEDAQYRLDHPAPVKPARAAFKAQDYPDPMTKPRRTAAEILGEARGR